MWISLLKCPLPSDCVMEPSSLSTPSRECVRRFLPSSCYIMKHFNANTYILRYLKKKNLALLFFFRHKLFYVRLGWRTSVLCWSSTKSTVWSWSWNSPHKRRLHTCRRFWSRWCAHSECRCVLKEFDMLKPLFFIYALTKFCLYSQYFFQNDFSPPFGT